MPACRRKARIQENPLCTVVMSEYCHPPSSVRFQPLAMWNHGNLQMALNSHELRNIESRGAVIAARNYLIPVLLPRHTSSCRHSTAERLAKDTLSTDTGCCQPGR